MTKLTQVLQQPFNSVIRFDSIIKPIYILIIWVMFSHSVDIKLLFDIVESF